jgi:hypothetical protein
LGPKTRAEPRWTTKKKKEFTRRRPWPHDASALVSKPGSEFERGTRAMAPKLECVWVREMCAVVCVCACACPEKQLVASWSGHPPTPSQALGGGNLPAPLNLGWVAASPQPARLIHENPNSRLGHDLSCVQRDGGRGRAPYTRRRSHV